MNDLDYDEEDTRIMFWFEHGSYFSRQLVYSIVDKHFSMDCYNSFGDMQKFDFDVTDEDLCEIGKIVEPVKAWKQNYDVIGVDDGFGWIISYRYGETYIKSEGYEDFPKDFIKVATMLQEYMEPLCKRYDPDHYNVDEGEIRKKLAPDYLDN
ncbi:hypothetical protein [Anaerovibrio lipolyticus]|uniref:hypothetical protein n=1 Tax=Anaerovibrio lipolyticus TaxID=82374 RepID=UPI0026EAFE6D|nr:hypothetical protein [Anaerovibrio lipolyticus]MBE6106019.1 hypothetical protein [Anaerovibrio lipolyticus]